MPFTADDVVFTSNMLLTGPATLSYSSAFKQIVESVEKVDDYTVRFKFRVAEPRMHLLQDRFFTIKAAGGIRVVPKRI